jgi:ABC-2 type transport system permease protein
MWHILKRKLWMQRNSLKMMLAMSGISLMMIFAFGGFGGSYKPQVLISDLDQSPLSKKFVSALESDKSHQYQLMEIDKGKEMVKEGKSLAMLTIEKGFEERVKTDEEPLLSLMSVKSDAEIMVLKPLILNRYNQMKDWHLISTDVSKQAVAKGQNFEKVYQETYDKLRHNSETKIAISLKASEDQSKANKNEALMHSVIGFIIFFVSYSAVFGAADILEERKLNTWQRLLISPSSKLGMIIGNLLVSWILGMVQMALVLFAGAYLFKVDFGGNEMTMFLAGTIFCLAMSGFGIFLSAVAKSMQQVSALTSVALTAFGMLGGCLWPIDLVTNPVLIGLSKVIPHTYAVKAMTQLSRGESLTSVLPLLVVLMSMAIVFLGIGFVKLMRTEEQYQ